jgi:CxxC motif-containing protein
MKEMTCIVCPNGCSLIYDEETKSVTGNRCPRGKQYALEEITCPKRTVCSSVKSTVKGYSVVSVRTDQAVNKALINKVMQEIDKAVISSYLPIGSIVIKNVLGTDANIITTTDMVKGE